MKNEGNTIITDGGNGKKPANRHLYNVKCTTSSVN